MATSWNEGTKVLVYGRMAGVIRYIGPLSSPSIGDKKETWYGIQLDKPEGYSDGYYQGTQYFQCEPDHAIFARKRALKPYTQEDLAAVKIQVSWKKHASKKPSNATPSDIQLEVKTDQQATGRRRPSICQQLVVDEKSRDRRSSLFSPEKEDLKSQLLWKCFNELDWLEESELVESYEQYVKLVRLTREAGGAAKREEAKQVRAKTKQASSGLKAKTPSISEEVPALPAKITAEYVQTMMTAFANGHIMAKKDVVELLIRVTPVLRREPNIRFVNITARVTVVGDLHGQLDDLLNIFKLNGLPAARNQYVFNGDFVDRGKNSVEVMLTLLMLKLLSPDHVTLNRGNHESKDINSRDGFQMEVGAKYDMLVFDVFATVFACMPFGTVVENKVFITHGGLFPEDVTLMELQRQNRFHQIPPRGSLMESALWSDPVSRRGRTRNRRGAGLKFGPDVTERFLAINNLELIIRSHECKKQGFDRQHGGRVLTVFSASNYCGKVGNDGAYVVLEKDQIPLVIPYYTQDLGTHDQQALNLERYIVTRLAERIAAHRLALIEYYGKLADPETHTVTHKQWMTGLAEILEITQIPFSRFQQQLGVPLIGVDGKANGTVDYMAFLSRFRPKHQLLDSVRSELRRVGGRADSVLDRMAEQLVFMLFVNRYSLQSLFRYFDKNGDGWITPIEFEEGIQYLSSSLHEDYSREEIAAVVAAVDKDKNGVIDYSEFFDSFQVELPPAET